MTLTRRDLRIRRASEDRPVRLGWAAWVRPVKNNVILLVEDNADDADLTVRAFAKSGVLNEVVVVRERRNITRCHSDQHQPDRENAGHDSHFGTIDVSRTR